jgi:clan AA aspartic protease
MGTFKIAMGVGGPRGDKFVTTEALVDTGATHTLLPGKLLRELGIRSLERIPFQLAEERTVEYEIGEARIRLDGRERTTIVVFGSDDMMPLVGATTLELFNLAVDPVRQRLVPVPGLMK